MHQPIRSELGSQIAVVPRPLTTMRAWLIVSGAVVVLFALSPHTSVGQTIGAAVGSAILLLVVRFIGAVRIFELGLESNGIRMLWDKLVAYRMSHALVGSQQIVLIEQATARELSVFLSVFQSNEFREAVGDRVELSALVQVGLP
jgi:hypothetical protein